jgi:hypothetical protein
MVDEYVSGDPLQCVGEKAELEKASNGKGYKAPVMRSVISDREMNKSFRCVSD